MNDPAAATAALAADATGTLLGSVIGAALATLFLQALPWLLVLVLLPVVLSILLFLYRAGHEHEVEPLAVRLAAKRARQGARAAEARR